MRCIFAVARRPITWLPIFFLAAIWYYRAEVVPNPQFVVPTGAVFKDEGFIRPHPRGASVLHVSDDGVWVTIELYHGDFRFSERRLERWDARSGTNITPQKWQEPEWEQLFTGRSGIFALAAEPTGNAFLNDDVAWTGLRQRLASGRTKALEDLRKTIRPDLLEGTVEEVIPRSAYFSPDSRFFAYVVRNGWPLYVVSESLGDGTAIEYVRTGEQLAFLPGITDSLCIAPGGRTAVTVNHDTEREGEQPRLFLWDLETSTCRAKLLLPEVSNPFGRSFSSDGRYVFASYYDWVKYSRDLRWWDTTNGQRVGSVIDQGDTTLIDGDRVLVTYPGRGILYFWNVATGAKEGEWDLGSSADLGGTIEGLRGSDNSRYLAGLLDLKRPENPAVVRLWKRKFQEPKYFSMGAAPDPRQIVLWDVSERRELARLPGRSAAFSSDGSWLASIDEAGIIRVWPVPIQRPWGRILSYSAGAALVGWVALLLLGRVGPGTVRDLARKQAWLWSTRKRRRWTVALVGGTALALTLVGWEAATTARARKAMQAAYERVHDGMTEADVTALVGSPPVEGSVSVMSNRATGWQRPDPATLRKWRWHGTEMDVWLGEDGTVKGAALSKPVEVLDEIANWVGW